MKTVKKRYQRRQSNEFYGEAMATELIGFLNRSAKAPKGRRVAAFIELFQELSQLLDAHRKPDGSGARLTGEASLKSMKLIYAITDQFRKYPLTRYPTFEGLASGPRMASAFHFKFGVRSKVRGISDEEAGARDAVERLAEAGAVDNVRKCAGCEQWFYRRFKPQRCCSTSCRMRDYQRSEEAKKYKREHAKRYYWMHHHKNTK